MAQWILKSNGRVVPRLSLQPLKVDDLHSVTELNKPEIFDGFIERRWGISINPKIASEAENLYNEFKEYNNDEEAAHIVPDIKDKFNVNVQLMDQNPAYNNILQSEMSLQIVE